MAAGPSWPDPLGPQALCGSRPRGQVDLAPWGLLPSMDRGRGAKLTWPLGASGLLWLAAAGPSWPFGASGLLWVVAAGPSWPGPLGPLTVYGSWPRGQVDLAPGASDPLWIVAAGPSWPGPLGPLTVYGSWPRGHVGLAPWGLWPSVGRGRGAKLTWPLGASYPLWIMAAGPSWPGPLGLKIIIFAKVVLLGSRPRGQVGLAPWGLWPPGPGPGRPGH